MAILRLANMEFYGYHGVTEEEKNRGGRFEVDCEIETDISGCAASDDVQDALDYEIVYHIIREQVENQRYSLMETLAARIKDEIKRRTGAPKVAVKVRKMKPPVAGQMGYFEIEISD